MFYDRVILKFNRSFVQELVVLHTRLFMFGKFLGACLEKIQRRTFYFHSLGAKLILAPLDMSKKRVWPSMRDIKKFLIQASTPTPSMQQKLTKHGKSCMQNSQIPTQEFGPIKG
jgi:hypothetical protein